MQIIRTFHSVGQGAFYSEDHEGKIVVYDCGGTNKEIVNKEVKSAFKKGQTIEAVFISHLHYDHINGLETLLNHCRVRRLFLPLLTDIGKAISYIYNRIHGEITEFETSLIFGNDETIEDTQLFRISGNIERQPEVVPFNSIDHANSDQFSSKLCFENYSSWLFIPFNILHKIRSDQLEEAFEKYNIPTDLEKLKILLADKFNHKIIAEAFKSIDGDLNTNSLILYSGPEHTSFEHFLIFLQKHNGLGNYFCDFDYRFYFGAGCMYFGDFDAHDSNNWQQFVQFYNKYWKNVQTVQIPHHGSIHSYNKEINYSSKKICLMSAAEKNRYRHPHAATLKEIVKARALPIIVTEHKSTTTIFEITTIDSFYKKILQKRLDQDL